MKIKKITKTELKSWWNELPIVIKFCYAEKHNRFLHGNITEYLELVDLDDLYYALRNDDDISDILGEYNSIRWERFDYLGEMISLYSDGVDEYELFTDNEFLSELLFDIVKKSPSWFAEIILKNKNSKKLVDRELRSFYKSKTIKLNCIDDIRINPIEKNISIFDLKKNFPNLENIILKRTNIEDFDFFMQFYFLKFIHLGVLQIPFKEHPDTIDFSDPITIKDISDNTEIIEYQTIKYKKNNPDLILLKSYLNLITKLKFVAKIKFMLDIENSEYMLEPEILFIIKNHFPNSTFKRIYEPIITDEIEINN